MSTLRFNLTSTTTTTTNFQPNTVYYIPTAGNVISWTSTSVQAWRTKNTRGWNGKLAPRCSGCGRYAKLNLKSQGMLVTCKRCKGDMKRW